MKKSIKKTLLMAVILSTAVSVHAGTNNVKVSIQIDSEFQNKNIIFVTAFDHQQVGIHKAGSPLMSQMNVKPVVLPNGEYPEIKIQAYMTDSSLKLSTEFYEGKYTYQLQPDTHIALSFPAMFYKQ